MFRRRRKPSIHDEPHFQPRAGEKDPSEAVAGRAIDRERDRGAYRPGNSVYDEPDIFPGRTGEVIVQDWTCRSCGYNLRGIPLEMRCPECGKREWYRPPPPGREHFRLWFESNQQRISARQSWVAAALAAAAGGVFAIVGALLEGPGGAMALSMPLISILFAPVVEESLKVAAAGYLVEAKPYVLRDSAQIWLAAVGAAAVFAAVENAFYLLWLRPNPSVELVVWRWTVCVAVHMICTGVAARGLVRAWRECVTEYRVARVATAFPDLVVAILLHAAYNAAAIGYNWLF